jgi:hypothetical protein
MTDASHGDTPPPLDPSSPIHGVAAKFAVAEYKALRDEVLEHMARNGQILTLTVLALGTLLASGVQFHNPALVLVYPIVATALAWMWKAEEGTIKKIGLYVRTNFEDKISRSPLASWENFVYSDKSFKTRFSYPLFIFYFSTESISLIVAGVMSHDIQGAVSALLSGNLSSFVFSSDTLFFALGFLADAISVCILLPGVFR